MSASGILPTQIRAIHAIKTKVRLDEGSYRALLQGYGVASSKYLTRDDADRLLARLRVIPGADTPAAPGPAGQAGGRYAKKFQALWIAGWNLGIVRDRRDHAMHAFVERQSGISHTRFLRDAADARAAIEGLKAWIARESGLVWPAPSKERAATLLAIKRAVLVAQWRRCLALGLVEPSRVADECDGLVDYVSQVARGRTRLIGALEDGTVTPEDLDKASAALGRKIRAAQAPTREARHVG